MCVYGLYLVILVLLSSLPGHPSTVAEIYRYPVHLHLAPPLWFTAVVFRGHLLHQKTKVLALLCSAIGVILRLAILVELQLVTGTDGRTGVGSHTPHVRSPEEYPAQGHSI